MGNIQKNIFSKLCVGLFMAAGLLTACSDKNTAASSGAAQTAPTATGAAGAVTSDPASRDYITIGVDARSMPLTFWDEKTNELAGHDADLAREAFKRAGLKYEFRAIDWNSKEDELKNGTIDVVWSGLTITDERAKDFAFTTPYYKNRQAILVRADSNITSGDDLRGKKIAMQSGSPSAAFVRRLQPAEEKEYIQLPDMFAAILTGEIDAAVTDGAFIDYYATNNPGKYRILSENVVERGFAVGLRHGDRDLLDKINKALAEMEADGTIQTINSRWFGVGQ